MSTFLEYSRGTQAMTDPESEMGHVKFAYIDNYIYIYLYVEKISSVHWYFSKKDIWIYFVFLREIYTIDFMLQFLLIKVLIFDGFSFN